MRKVDGGVTTYALRSTVLGGQVVAELTGWGSWYRGYVYLGGQLLALQDGGVKWVHQDPVVKSQRLTDYNQNVLAAIEVDPWGGETSGPWSWNQQQQPRKYTTYERDGNGEDEAMQRRYNRWWSRFSQPDPYDGSMNLADPQSLNRYAYVQNDPVNFVDPSGLNMWSGGSGYGCDAQYGSCGGGWDGTGGASGMGGYGFSGGLFDSERFNAGSAAEAAYERRVQEAFDNWRATQRAADQARAALANGNAAALIAILESNSNVGISINGQRYFGGQAVAAFNSFQRQQDFGGGGAGGSWNDIRLYRFGGGNESLEKLRRDAENAESKSGIYGVSVTSNTPRFPAPSALKSEVERYFTVQKTGGPGHYTVVFPKPLTQGNADIFNNLFRNKHK